MPSREGQEFDRILEAECYVMKSRGEWFRFADFVTMLNLPSGTAHRYISILMRRQIIERDEDIPRYRMSIPYRNMLVAVGACLKAMRVEERVS